MVAELSKLESDILLGFLLGNALNEMRMSQHATVLRLIVEKLKVA